MCGEDVLMSDVWEVLSDCLSQLQRSEGAAEPMMWVLNTVIICCEKCCQTLQQKCYSLWERIKKLVNRLLEQRDPLTVYTV